MTVWPPPHLQPFNFSDLSNAVLLTYSRQEFLSNPQIGLLVISREHKLHPYRVTGRCKGLKKKKKAGLRYFCDAPTQIIGGLWSVITEYWDIKACYFESFKTGFKFGFSSAIRLWNKVIFDRFFKQTNTGGKHSVRWFLGWHVRFRSKKIADGNNRKK